MANTNDNRYTLQYDDPDYPEDKHLEHWTVAEIIEYINADRSEQWTDYDESDWEEGLREWTHYKIIARPTC